MNESPEVLIRNATTVPPIEDAPCLCPLWPIEEIFLEEEEEGSVYLYYCEYHDNEFGTGACSNLPQAGYLQGVFPWPIFCPDDACEGVAKKIKGKLKSGRVRTPFGGRRSYHVVGDRFSSEFPTPIARRFARETTAKVDGRDLRFGYATIGDTTRHFEITQIDVEIPSVDSDGSARLFSKVFILGREIEEETIPGNARREPFVVSPIAFDGDEPNDKELVYAYRGVLEGRTPAMNKPMLLLLKGLYDNPQG